MAPSKAAVAPYAKDERVLCFHHEMLYEAKILDSRPTDDGQSWQYRIHYKGWKNTWDDWVPQDRVRKFTDENKELAAQLHTQMKALQQKQTTSAKAAKKGGRANGSDFSSARGSEERHMSTAAQGGRGPRKNRDYDLETREASPKQVSGSSSLASMPRTPIPLKPSSQGGSSSSSLSSISRTPTPPEFASSTPPTVSGDSDSPAEPNAKRRKTSSTAFDRRQPRSRPPNNRPARLTRDERSALRDSWKDPKSDQWDCKRWLESADSTVEDHLTKLPPKDYSYIGRDGKLKDPHKYAFGSPWSEPHPRLAELAKTGNLTNVLKAYYHNMPHGHRLPIAGIAPPDHRLPAPYHLAPTTLLKSTFDNLLEVLMLMSICEFQEEGFHARPSIKLVMPDHLKAILVDDWENVTKNTQLVPVPSAHPVSQILEDYLVFEKPKREPGSPQADILEEAVAGLKTYFDKCLGRILLYRFERTQYLEILEATRNNSSDLAGKSISEIYGAEHFCRLLVSLPELIAQTNMDQQSVNRLREELLKITNFLGKNVLTYFASEYETPNQAYIEKAKGY